MSSSSRRSSNNGRAFSVRPWERADTRCNCGDVAGLWTSGTTRNPGRKFVSCPNYLNPERSCSHFRWIEPENEEDCYRDLIYELRLQVKRCEREKDVGLLLIKKTKKRVVQMKIIMLLLILMNMLLFYAIFSM